MMALAEAMWDTTTRVSLDYYKMVNGIYLFESDLDDTLVDDIMIEKSNGVKIVIESSY